MSTQCKIQTRTLIYANTVYTSKLVDGSAPFHVLFRLTGGGGVLLGGGLLGFLVFGFFFPTQIIGTRTTDHHMKYDMVSLKHKEGFLFSVT